jgi:hypothetical protein
MEKYVPPKPAPLPEDFDEFYASLTPLEKELHALATEKLASSYFVQWSHFYKEWALLRKSAQNHSDKAVSGAGAKAH